MNTADAATNTGMSITMTMIIITMSTTMGSIIMKRRADAVMTMNTNMDMKAIITRMKCLQAGGFRRFINFGRKELEDILSMLSTTGAFGTVLRAKGIVQAEDDSWMEFDMVPEESEIRSCQPDYTGRICVIGTELKTEELEKVFGK